MFPARSLFVAPLTLQLGRLVPGGLLQKGRGQTPARSGLQADGQARTACADTLAELYFRSIDDAGGKAVAARLSGLVLDRGKDRQCTPLRTGSSQRQGRGGRRWSET